MLRLDERTQITNITARQKHFINKWLGYLLEIFKS
jgi:hypothetical protein